MNQVESAGAGGERYLPAIGVANARTSAFTYDALHRHPRVRLPAGGGRQVTLLVLAAALALGALPPSLRGSELERLPTRARVVVLTIDGGGNSAAAASMLRTLRSRRIPATFFLTGRFVQRYPRLARAIGREFPVANHSYSHIHLTPLSSAAVTREITRAGRAIRNATRRDPRPFFRFPYGDRDRRTIAIANRLGYVSFGWSIDTWGWMGVARQSRAGIVRKVVAGLEPGAIVLMHLGSAHDGSTLDAQALPAVIDAVRRRGYTFTTLERLRRS